MRILSVTGGLLVAGTVLAGPSKSVPAKATGAQLAIERVVRANIVKLGELAADDQLGLAKDAIVIGETGRPIKLGEDDGCLSGSVANAFYGCLQASISHAPGAITTGLDATGNVAWFQAPFTSTMIGEDDAGKEVAERRAMRVGGIATRRGPAWEIVAALYVIPVSDKVLLRGGGEQRAVGAPRLVGDPELAGLVADWFSSGFAPVAAKAGPLIASGTSPAEYKTGRGAVALARRWDKLKLGATTVEAKLLAKGAIGWVVADVVLPRKNGKGGVPMKLAATVVPEGDGWRWVSLQYQPAFVVGG